VELAYWRTVVQDTVYRYSTFVTNTSAYARMSTYELWRRTYGTQNSMRTRVSPK
jgi:ribosomal protein L32E